VATKEEVAHVFILSFPAKEKNQIFERVLKWIADTSKSVKPVIGSQDKVSGSVVAHGNTSYKADGAWVAGILLFTMNVDVRPGKARVRFVNLRYSAFGGPPNPLPEEGAWHRPAQKKFAELVDSLKAFVDKKETF
jgi:hypothetical protein